MSYEPIWDGRSGYAGRRGHPIRNLIFILLCLGLLLFAALEIYIGVHSKTEIVGEPEVMVIFGCQVKPWGPSTLLQDRLDTALDYLEDHPDMTVIVTGGKGDDEHMSEAQCMYDYLTDHGINGENIYMEDQSRNTWQNVTGTTNLVNEKIKEQEEGWDLDMKSEVLVVSSGFHLARIKMLMERYWVSARPCTISTLAAPVSHKPSAIQMFFREPLALVKSFLFDR